MRILICTKVFLPSLGGVEMVAATLACELVRRGHAVVVVTDTMGESTPKGYTVVRQPGWGELWAAYRSAEVVVLMGATLRLGWPLFLMRRRALISHQGFPPGMAQTSFLTSGSRGLLIRRAINVACSRKVSEAVGNGCTSIGNPYDTEHFYERSTVGRDLDLAFVGRLVPEKGPDLLLDAVALLANEGWAMKVSLVGDGPLKESLAVRAKDLGLTKVVTLTGPKRGHELAAFLNRHKVMVVPSAWPEPFGIVALEGAACGCVVVGSDGGGLPEAIGPAGMLFRSGDVQDLAAKLKVAMACNRTEGDRIKVQAHLSVHTPEFFAGQLLKLLGNKATRDK